MSQLTQTRRTGKANKIEKSKKPTAAILRLLKEAPTPDLIPARNYRATLPDLPKDQKKRQAKLYKLLGEYESHLASDVKQYEKLCLATAEEIEREWSGNESHYNLQLKINHISYQKQHINTVLECLGRADRFESGESPNINMQNLQWEHPEAEILEAKKEPTKAVTFFADTVIPINTSEIVPSPFEPQEMRRETFTPEEINKLGESILKHGLLEPILVRPAGGSYEIVFGELRWLAVRSKGIKAINCFVRELTDAKVLELQYEENHRRHQNNPLIDASYFKLLKEKEGYSNEELADRLSTSTANVVNKLILGDLIDAAKTELKSGLLPLKHAYFLARFPAATQELICKEQYAYKYYDREDGAASYKTFVEEVEENITRKLENAPFSTIDTRLRLDGLICPDCTQRTGFAPMLFTDLSKNDSCLNKSCFEQKTNVHLRLKRDEIALQLPNPENAPIEEKVKEVPLVTDRSYADKTPFVGEKPLTNQKFLPEPECEFSEISLIVEGSRKGEQTYICTQKNCPVHNPQPATDLTDADFVRRVELLTREKVLAKSIEFFTDYKPIWMYDDLIQRLILEIWHNTVFDVRRNILPIFKDWKGLPKDPNDRKKIREFISTLDKTKQSQLIFLFIFRSEGLYQNSNQDGIKKLAEDYARVDYRLLEAEARLELAPESEKVLAQDILTVTRAGVNDLRKPDFDLDAVH